MIVLLANCIEISGFRASFLCQAEKAAVRTAYEYLDNHTRSQLEKAAHNGVPLPFAAHQALLDTCVVQILTLYENDVLAVCKDLLLKYPDDVKEYDAESLQGEVLVYFVKKFSTIFPRCYIWELQQIASSRFALRMARESRRIGGVYNTPGFV